MATIIASESDVEDLLERELEDPSVWSEQQYERFFFENPEAPQAKAFWKARAHDVREEIMAVMRRSYQCQILRPISPRRQKLIELFDEQLNAAIELFVDDLGIFSEREIDTWSRTVGEEAFNDANARYNAYPNSPAALRFFALYPECRGNLNHMSWAQIAELMAAGPARANTKSIDDTNPGTSMI